ncbi:hypothetical protein OG352_22820 [Streptomyces sp. NBC_01485]|uniref:hypothetical protein n=1 Tax=Streptomyces sp. NBC_01485 TaxID=2903884 RepID=UPI002E37CB3B|nr:hypothetical protein [Streptomyces sp. NBC_01485]
MDAGVATAVAGAVISAGAAGIAVWQTRIAKRQAQLAEDSAASAQRQATAAEEQVEIMRRQLAGEEADRVEARRPHFKVELGHVSWEDVNFPRGELVIKQDDGVALSSVVVTPSGSYVLGLRGERTHGECDEGYARVQSLDLGSMSDGADAKFYIDLEYRHVTPLRVELELKCSAREGGHIWTEHLVTTLDRRPDPPRTLGPPERRRLGRSG